MSYIAKFTTELKKFSPQDAEKITGLSTVRQRDFRRHGYLQTNKGHARFDIFELAEMYILKQMLDRNIGPKESKSVSNDCARGIVWQIFSFESSYDGDISQINSIDIQPNSLKKEIQNDPAFYLRSGIFGTFELRKQLPEDYFIWWADGTYQFHDYIIDAFEGQHLEAEKLKGPIVVLSLKSLAADIKTKANSAFATVKISEDRDI